MLETWEVCRVDVCVLKQYWTIIYLFEVNSHAICRFAKLYRVTEGLLKYFMFSAGPQVYIYEKFIEKAVPLCQNMDKDIVKPFM